MERLGKYDIISEIGRGAMGAVYKARDPLIGRLVALKTITSGMSAQANSLERFYQEARSAGALQHPNIVTIYELGHESNTPFIAMEFIEGGSLDHLVEQRQSSPLSVKLGYIVRVCEALSYAHRHNVVHRDIKPGNIMVTKEGVVKVVDFGIARLTDMSLTQQNMMIGSRAYMSPQLYKGERADARADIWATGVTLYELLTGKRPFLGENEAELMFHIMSDEPPALKLVVPDCPEELSRIVEKMLAKKVEDRYQSMDEVLRDLEPLWKSAQQATVAGLLADSQQLFAANDLQRAQALLRKALQIDVGNTQVKTLLEKVSSELRRSQLLPKLSEHLERGRTFLRTGKLQEARSEVDAALGLDSRHEPARQLFGELEVAAARAQEVEQKLRLTKQRLAEGALTEAATALGQALDMDAANKQAQELRRQIEEERNRREKRKKLSEVLHQARTLWTALNYEECLKVLSEGLREFPREPELLKLQEMARHDLEDLQKQRQLGEARKLLGRQEFAQAAKIIDALAKTYPHDSAVSNLQMLVRDGEREQQNAIRFAKELSSLRAILADGKFGEAVSKGDALLREYPEEFELKELVGYARSELAQLQQRQKENECEKEIRNLFAREQFKDAEAAAKRATLQFPKVELFRKLAEEAGQKRQVQEQSERARQEMQRRIDEINGMIKQGQIPEAIDRAQQTIGKFGPDPNVTQLLQAASSKQDARKKKEDQDRQFAAAQTLVDAGNFAGATQVLNQAMATQIFERSDPRVQQQLRVIEQLSNSGKDYPATEGQARPGKPTQAGNQAGDGKSPATPGPASGSPVESATGMFSATMVLGSQSAGTTAKTTHPAPRTDGADKDVAFPKKSSTAARPPVSERTPGASASGKAAAGKESENLFALPAPAPEHSVAAKRPLIPPEVLAQIQALIKKPAVVGGIGALVVVLITVLVLGRITSGKEKEKKIRDRAEQLWTSHQLDQAEDAWRQLEQMHGTLGKEAAKEISQIEEKRQLEKRRFDEGEKYLNEDKNYEAAMQAFTDVKGMGLWLTERANSELAAAQELLKTQDVHVQEKMHFDRGETLFRSSDFENARKEFQAALDLKVPGSTIRPDVEKYLKRIRQNTDTKKLYDSALANIKDEKWADAESELQEVVNAKGVMAGEAKKKLLDVTPARKAEESVNRALQAGAYRSARSQLDTMKWPKTKERLQPELQRAEQKEANSFKTRAAALQANEDLLGLERLREELHNFAGRAVEDDFVKWANVTFDKWLDDAEKPLRAKQGDKTSFDAAVADFNAAKEKGDSNRLNHEVKDKFQKIAKSPGAFREQAQVYVDKTIPAALEEMNKPRSGKVSVPPIVCAGGQDTGATPAKALGMTCAKLDAGVSLEWIGTAVVEMPNSANLAAKLPYTLHLIVTVEANGKVKVDKDGEADKDFLKKAKDAAKTWKATIPKSGGKPVGVSFPLSITFPK